MNTQKTLGCLLLAAVTFSFGCPLRAEQEQAGGGSARPKSDARALLERGRDSGKWPDGLIIRIGACLGELDDGATDTRLPEQLIEQWEFTATHIHRLEIDTKDGERVHQRVESRPYDSKNLCRVLLEGKAIEIPAGQGKGPPVVLQGTPYGRGSRSIEVLVKGEAILDLHETNGPALIAYPESDARAFGALYEHLARQARRAFTPQGR